MKKLHEIYKLHPDDVKNRHKLKLRLKETFLFYAELVHAVSKGEAIAPKHYFLSLGIYNMTGQKMIVKNLDCQQFWTLHQLPQEHVK